MAHYESPHLDLHCLQIQLFSSLVLELKTCLASLPLSIFFFFFLFFLERLGACVLWIYSWHMVAMVPGHQSTSVSTFLYLSKYQSIYLSIIFHVGIIIYLFLKIMHLPI